MRKIKFRAYVNNPIHGKGVFPVKSIHFNPFVCEVVMGDEIVNFFDFDDIALLEYTGLKDKNGTEIYEGDIIGDLDVEETENIITLKPRIFTVKWNNAILGFLRFDNQIGRFKGHIGLYDEDFSHIEVIGNIYEHPHLLGGEEE